MNHLNMQECMENEATEEVACLQERIKYLEELNSFKDKALSILMHDLRGPVNSLRSILSIPCGELTIQEQELFWEELGNQLTRMSETMEGLFEWASKSFKDDGAAYLQISSPKEVIAQVASALEPRLLEKQVLFTTSLHSDLTIMASRYEVEIILRNLIQNSIKFTAPGGRITLSLTEEGDQIQIKIADTGVGMTPKQLESAFTMNTSSTQGTGGEKGKGLGLMLCKFLVERSGGSIEISSKLNAGTTITVSFPVHNAHVNI